MDDTKYVGRNSFEVDSPSHHDEFKKTFVGERNTERINTSIRVAQMLQDRDSTTLTTAEIKRSLPEENSIVFSLIHGKELSELILNQELTPEHMEYLARAMAEFHTISEDPSIPELSQRTTLVGFSFFTSLPFPLLTECSGANLILLRALQELNFGEVLKNSEQNNQRRVLTHQDLRGTHIIFSDEQVYLIDLEECAWSTPEVDLAGIVVELFLRSLMDIWTDRIPGSDFTGTETKDDLAQRFHQSKEYYAPLAQHFLESYRVYGGEFNQDILDSEILRALALRIYSMTNSQSSLSPRMKALTQGLSALVQNSTPVRNFYAYR